MPLLFKFSKVPLWFLEPDSSFKFKMIKQHTKGIYLNVHQTNQRISRLINLWISIIFSGKVLYHVHSWVIQNEEGLTLLFFVKDSLKFLNFNVFIRRIRTKIKSKLIFTNPAVQMNYRSNQNPREVSIIELKNQCWPHILPWIYITFIKLLTLESKQFPEHLKASNSQDTYFHSQSHQRTKGLPMKPRKLQTNS